MTYEVYAVRYATKEVRFSGHFYGGVDALEDFDTTMDYFVWVVRSAEHTVLVDTGFSEETAARRGHKHHQSPLDALRDMNVRPDGVSHVISTHMHFDHIGNLASFPDSTHVLQDDEMGFWTGRYASRPMFSRLVEEDDILHLVRLSLRGKVHFVRGSEQILPGLAVHHVGGHTAGLQVVTVQSDNGTVVLCSDASHFYQNIEENRPFSLVHDLAAMYGAFDLIHSLADDPGLVIPGHDPLVMEKFPAAGPGLEGRAVRIA